MKIISTATALSATFFMISCAGPSNPFGASAFPEVRVKPEFKTRSPAKGDRPAAKITSYPANQLYHSPFDLVLQIHDNKRVPKDFRYEILYNGKKVDRWWSVEKIIFDPFDPHIANIVFDNLSLLPGRENKITFLYYRDSSAEPVVYEFNPPQCPFRAKREIASINPFKSEDVSVSKIEEIALRNEINPSLLAALVAQESSFNPLAISWAKAVGLTQVTSLANREILALKPAWQYDKKIERLNYAQLKARILANKITKAQDWRLDHLKSLEGGSIYLNLLSRYWQRDEALRALSQSFKENAPLTDILLASYNSGAYRVKKALIKDKENWLESEELAEARKYVNNIKSYCHAFTEK